MDCASEDADELEYLEATRQRTIDGVQRCLEILAASIGRDHERCGKTICARSRRCRGFACTADLEDASK